MNLEVNLPPRDRVDYHELNTDIQLDTGFDMNGDHEWGAEIEVAEIDMEMDSNTAIRSIKRFRKHGLEGLEPEIESTDQLLELLTDKNSVPKNVRRIGYEAVALEESLDDYEKVLEYGFQEDESLAVSELLKPVGYEAPELFNGIDSSGLRREGAVGFKVNEKDEDVKIRGNKALQLIPHSLGLLNWRQHADGREEPMAKIFFDIKTEEEGVNLHIYDNGPGFDLDEISIDELIEYNEDSGIGFSYSNELLEMAGGELEVGNREEYDGEAGAYTKVTLPRYNQ